mmetsp:Transcript_8467/g.14529  ORF Transcript_8467/g.14529 Transcript_8467/m.14529 type:complete len:245 (+) Transcript_8467:82-816(+)
MAHCIEQPALACIHGRCTAGRRPLPVIWPVSNCCQQQVFTTAHQLGRVQPCRASQPAGHRLVASPPLTDHPAIRPHHRSRQASQRHRHLAAHSITSACNAPCKSGQHLSAAAATHVSPPNGACSAYAGVKQQHAASLHSRTASLARLGTGACHTGSPTQPLHRPPAAKPRCRAGPITTQRAWHGRLWRNTTGRQPWHQLSAEQAETSEETRHGQAVGVSVGPCHDHAPHPERAVAPYCGPLHWH